MSKFVNHNAIISICYKKKTAFQYEWRHNFTGLLIIIQNIEIQRIIIKPEQILCMFEHF